MYVLPAGQKNLPFSSYSGPLKASKMLAYIEATANSQVSIELIESVKELESLGEDKVTFEERLKMER